MSHLSRRCFGGLVILCAAAVGTSVKADAPAPLAGQLESQAVVDFHDGHFDQGAALLDQAAGVDAQLKPVAVSADSFDSLEKTFAAAREADFQKNVADVHRLIDHGMRTYAIDVLQQAFVRSADKAAFRKEKWVDDLVRSAAEEADEAEINEHWVTALRIYSDLTGVDESEPRWKKKLKEVTRRIRMVAMYAPDQFKQIQKDELEARKPADALLHPTTQPATEPVVEDDNTDFRQDWHDEVRGASFDMLLDSLFYAEHDYYRQADIQTLMLGGIGELKDLTSTAGLETAFPGLTNQTKKGDFLWALDQATTEVKHITPDNEEDSVRNILSTLVSADHDSVNIPDDVFVTEFTDGALDTLDPFSDMIWPYDLAEFMQQMKGDFTGVGIQIEIADDGNLKVISPLEDTPAYKAGIKAGDVVIRINGKNAKGISINQAVKNITGPAHTTVVLTVRSPDGSIHNYPIERDVINVASVKGYAHLPGGGWDYFVDPKDKIGYVRVTNFSENTSAELGQALDDLKAHGAKGLIVDLRYNPGGLLTSAVDVASYFLRSGVVVSTHPDRETENRPTENDAHPMDQTTDMPLAVLVNQYSASASEIVSGSLKDHGRATIVGERTFGKGSVQMTLPLSNKTALLKLTTSHYYLPSGRCLHREENSTVWGVDPDVKIELTPEQMRAAIDARTEMEVLHDAAPVNGKPTTQPDLMAADPQLSGALLVLKMKLAGVPI